jgi:hypothetical protein
VLLLEQAPVALKVVLNIDPARKAMLLAVAPLAILLAVAPLAILLAVAPLAMVLSEVTSPVEDDANGMDDAARQRTTRTAASHTRPVCISLSAMAFHPLLPAQRPHGMAPSQPLGEESRQDCVRAIQTRLPALGAPPPEFC